jgi:hypothetical protein
MVTIVGFQKRTNAEDQEFHVLVLQGGIELIKSSESGNFYATAKRATITSTFNDVMCRQLIGKKLPGKVERVPCEEYEFAIPGSDEVIKLSHTYRYDAEPASAEEHVFQPEQEMQEA